MPTDSSNTSTPARPWPAAAEGPVMPGDPILFVTQYYRPELIGSGPFCADLAEWLAQHGRDVTALTGRPHYPRAEVFPGYEKGRGRETVNGVRVERLSSWIPKRRSAVFRILGEAAFLVHGLWALATGRTGRHGVVLSLCPSILSVALANIARRPGGLHIAVVHDIQSGLAAGLGLVGGRGLIKAMRWAERAALNRADLVVVLSQNMARQLRDIGVTTPIDVVPIWVDTASVQPMEPVEDGPLKILYSGNLGKKQGVGQLLDLAEELQVLRPDIEIILRGSGNQAQGLAGEIATRGLKNVTLADLLPPDRLVEGLSLGHIHLVPQDPEGAEFAVPSKVYNIMAVGRPFVTTARPGSPLAELEASSGAFLCVPPNDRRAFAAAVMKLADDRDLRARLGARGRSFVERHYAKPRVLGDFLARLDTLHAGR